MNTVCGALIVTVMFFVCSMHAIAQDSLDNELQVTDADRDHWSFKPIASPPIPAVHHSAWARTPIDRFILARLESESLSPAPDADRSTLARRLCFDMTGLPPTLTQLDFFLADDRPDAYRRLVDSLLASPEFGRRWGQYWLDLARFAETDGFEHDKIRPSAWKYRDWVIDAINQDMPYDEFVRWQIAGDVLAGNETGAIATAFCLSGPDMPDINSQAERKHVLMNEITSTVSSVFLSLQIGCAQCHDHKYDAISQADFYRLRAFFDSAVSLTKNKSVATLSDNADPDCESRLMIRGDWRRPGPTVAAAFPRIANASSTKIAAADSSNDRVELANWLVDPANPLAARTIVNRIWQHHFGRGLSSTPSDFGIMGDEPTHPQLLDFLASRLTLRQWSLKDVHREILLSSVYQMRSVRPHDESAANHWQASLDQDPDNRLLSRFPRRRLDAESLRDALFAVSGTLNGEVGGPGVSPPLPPEMIKTLKSGQWKTSGREADHYRRSIYVFARRNLRYPLLATFDRPQANGSCAARQPSTTAVQSLTLLNSEITLDAAKRLAGVICEQNPSDTDRVSDCYLRVFSRRPTEQEQEVCDKFLREQKAMLAKETGGHPDIAPLTELCRALLNTNEFMYVD